MCAVVSTVSEEESYKGKHPYLLWEKERKEKVGRSKIKKNKFETPI